MSNYGKIDKCKLKDMVLAGKSQASIAKEMGVQPSAVSHMCIKLGLPRQKRGAKPMSGPRWRGGRSSAGKGYILVYAPDHPKNISLNERRQRKANGGSYQKSIYVYEHRLVMEKHLGRYLLPGEVVHHINGIRSDNRIENLQLYTSNAQHLADELAGRCPKWSEAGKERTLAAVKRRWSNFRARKQGAIHLPENSDRLIA